MSIYLLATLDTKGSETALVRQLLMDWGFSVTLVDTGCIGEPLIEADVSRETLFAAAGQSLEALQRAGDRGEAVRHAAAGAASLVQAACERGKVDGCLALGGSAGTTIGTSAMRTLPLGIPKLMVSTLINTYFS